MISIDPASIVRSRSGFEDLVRSIFAAGPEDETDWLEWKSTLSLREPSSHARIAKYILGFANRVPASRLPDGYLVIGVEPGNLAGVDPVDPTDLRKWLDKLVGPVSWEAQTIGCDGASVLVIAVDAPQPGDSIHPLRKGCHDHRERFLRPGSVFIRAQSKTEQADAHQIDLLVERAKANRAPGPVVELMVGLVHAYVPSADGPSRWLAAERERIDDSARWSAEAVVESGLSLGKSVEEVLEEQALDSDVEPYLERCASTLGNLFPTNFRALGFGRCSVTITNHSEMPLEHPSLAIRLTGATIWPSDESAPLLMPTPPVMYGRSLDSVIESVYTGTGATPGREHELVKLEESSSAPDGSSGIFGCPRLASGQSASGTFDLVPLAGARFLSGDWTLFDGDDAPVLTGDLMVSLNDVCTLEQLIQFSRASVGL